MYYCCFNSLNKVTINKRFECWWWKCQNRNNVQTFRTVRFISGMFVMSGVTIPIIELKIKNSKVAFCTRTWTSDVVKISIEAARLACPESKDETHFLPLPLFVPIAEFDPANQCVGCGMSVRTEMLCDGKTRRIPGAYRSRRTFLNDFRNTTKFHYRILFLWTFSTLVATANNNTQNNGNSRRYNIDLSQFKSINTVSDRLTLSFLGHPNGGP